jgi:hypothetical protein
MILAFPPKSIIGCQDFGEDLITCADAAAGRTVLELGQFSTLDLNDVVDLTNDFSVTSGSTVFEVDSTGVKVNTKTVATEDTAFEMALIFG